MILETRAVAPFMKNGFVVGCEDTREGIVIDPGDDVDLLLDAVKATRLAIDYILLTHAHLDHVTGVGAREAGARRAGRPAPRRRLSLHGGRPAGDRVRIPRRAAAAGRLLLRRAGPWRFGRYAAWVHHTPGHCPGRRVPRGRAGRRSRARRCSSATRCSRARLAGPICRAGICRRCCDRFATCSSAFRTTPSSCSGHGEPTTIGREKRTNPFLSSDG